MGSSASTRRCRTGRICVQVLERQLDVVETERERVEVLLKIAANQEEHFLKFDIAAQRLEQALEISPAEERAYVALERCYRRLKQWLDLINTYERHISEAATTPTKIELYGSIAQVLRGRGGRRRSRDRRLPQHRRSRRHQRPGARSAEQALREAGRRGAGHRVDDARGGSDERRLAARRDVLPHR